MTEIADTAGWVTACPLICHYRGQRDPGPPVRTADTPENPVDQPNTTSHHSIVHVMLRWRPTDIVTDLHKMWVASNSCWMRVTF